MDEYIVTGLVAVMDGFTVYSIDDDQNEVAFNFRFDPDDTADAIQPSDALAVIATIGRALVGRAEYIERVADL
jgi:hypothetical protein